MTSQSMLHVGDLLIDKRGTLWKVASKEFGVLLINQLNGDVGITISDTVTSFNMHEFSKISNAEELKLARLIYG